ncbi:bleomycin resistance protein [Sphingomonas sp.]|uniref:bleomycin resistance protein n=1 Tax=Sphingomonas sp. TaxID=28214 RepID=UPI003B00021A
MTPPLPNLIPELDVADLAAAVEVYRNVLGFALAYERPDEAFAMLTRPGVAIMLQASAGPGRRFRTAPLERPFGRGVNFQIAVADLDVVYAAVRARGLSTPIPLEERSYRVDGEDRLQRQFVVADLDGYLLRFCAHSTQSSPIPR